MNLAPRLACLAFSTLLTACGGGSAPNSVAPPMAPPVQPLKPATLQETTDAFAKTVMTRYGSSAMTLSVMKNGKLLYERGYGFSDAAKTISLPADALMRSASTAKPITAAAIMQFASQGKLALTDRVFCTAANKPCHLPATLLPPGHDARLGDLTLAHLIDHRGGWDRTKSGDPADIEPAIRDGLGLQRPPTRAEVINFILTRPLDFNPGARSAYSNVGYLFLGEILEKTAGGDYVPHVHANILGPLGVPAADFKIARTLLKDRDPREPVYLSTQMAPSVFVKGTTALAMDEGVVLEHWLGAGAFITTARTLALFASAYRLTDGVALAGATHIGRKDGSLPGLTTLVRQLQSGVSYAFMMNVSVHESQDDVLVSEMDAAITAAGH